VTGPGAEVPIALPAAPEEPKTDVLLPEASSVHAIVVPEEDPPLPRREDETHLLDPEKLFPPPPAPAAVRAAPEGLFEEPESWTKLPPGVESPPEAELNDRIRDLLRQTNRFSQVEPPPAGTAAPEMDVEIPSTFDAAYPMDRTGPETDRPTTRFIPFEEGLKKAIDRAGILETPARKPGSHPPAYQPPEPSRPEPRRKPGSRPPDLVAGLLPDVPDPAPAAPPPAVELPARRGGTTRRMKETARRVRAVVEPVLERAADPRGSVPFWLTVGTLAIAVAWGAAGIALRIPAAVAVAAVLSAPLALSALSSLRRAS
jgi:hypothetical protein